MRILLFILSALLLSTIGCKEPNPIEPNTKRNVNDIVEYQIVAETEFGFSSELIEEMIIRDESELKRVITNYSNSDNLDLVDKLLKVNFENDVLVIISGKSLSEKAIISVDTIYIDGSGTIQIDYEIYRKNGPNSRVNSPTLSILIKDRKEARFSFNRKFIIEWDPPTFDGFETIATDIPIDTRESWKSVFRTAEEFKIWANKYQLTDTDFINKVNFDKEMVISVGTGHFKSGLFKYNIREMHQQANRLIVNSSFTVINHEIVSYKPNNHFVKLNKTNLMVYFAPININNLFNINKNVYSESLLQMNVEVDKESKIQITKVSNLADLFSVINPTDGLSPSNISVDFDFFDVLIIKAPTTNKEAKTYELNYLKVDNSGINGRITIYSNITSNTSKKDSYVLLKILKTDVPISQNFEVKVK